MFQCSCHCIYSFFLLYPMTRSRNLWKNA
jgi:hypothetical protein